MQLRSRRWPVCPFARLPVGPCARVPVCPCARWPVCPCARVPVCPYARMPVCPLARWPVGPCARVPVCPCARVPVCPLDRTSGEHLNSNRCSPAGLCVAVRLVDRHGINTDPYSTVNDPDALIEVSLEDMGTHRLPQDCLRLLDG